MVVAVKIPSILYQNFSRCDVDMPVVSFNFVPSLGYPLRVRQFLVFVTGSGSIMIFLPRQVLAMLFELRACHL